VLVLVRDEEAVIIDRKKNGGPRCPVLFLGDW